MKRLGLIFIASIMIAAVWIGFGISSTPKLSEVYTCSMYVTGIAVAKDGTIWASTRGGVLHRDQNGGWAKFTQLDGLPSNEALGVSISGDVVTVTFPEARADWNGGEWKIQPGRTPTKPNKAISSCTWHGKLCSATVTGLDIGGKSVDLPPSTGSHISALLPRDDKLWVAMFGDGIWEFDGDKWSSAKINLPPLATDITAIASNGTDLLIGTHHNGIWECSNGKWSPCLFPDEPAAGDFQVMQNYNGSLFISTLEDGLIIAQQNGWEYFGAPVISSNAPRQMVEFLNRLYVRHGNGKVDSFDGQNWRLNVFPSLPRKQVSCITADKSHIYVGQWGGWSEFDGKNWIHHVEIPELQGLQVTAILPEPDRIWIGTQGRGLAEVNRVTNAIKWHDEQNGLPDDWIKCLAKVGDTLYAGTFVGGLTRLDGNQWVSYPELKNTEVTDLMNVHGRLIVAARTGVYIVRDQNELKPLIKEKQSFTQEAQTLGNRGNELWIGTRTSLLKVEM